MQGRTNRRRSCGDVVKSRRCSKRPWKLYPTLGLSNIKVETRGYGWRLLSNDTLVDRCYNHRNDTLFNFYILPSKVSLVATLNCFPDQSTERSTEHDRSRLDRHLCALDGARDAMAFRTDVTAWPTKTCITIRIHGASGNTAFCRIRV